ncbi:hypothetical protein CORC01_03934 [Colletotrichum orchidophilum]|uniref:Uncharacterized protein n=1 Tax=Colletotrichum orchidophilum TaxID=1209926 RepID=A0A1G4BH70_9PEZI|nr:uncharacterized protein CORC01_03934 [Colletotrichum orchidophilum]OHF00860.1 hypothetical protein CORC01_03934 [Colletotrichum orchidophilum]
MLFFFVQVFVFSYLTALGLALPAASPAQGNSLGSHRFLTRAVRRLDTRAPQQDQETGASQGANNTANAGGAGRNNGVSDAQVMNAVMSWMQDTAKVTKFLNTATSFTGAEFTKQATIALNAEIDELNHKKVLDAAFKGTDMVTQANNVLDTQGNFQQVVDTLQGMVTNGPDTAQKDVDSINQNRCVNVLPNIDMYFAAAGAANILSVRPTGCLEVEGANVTPAVPPPANGGGNAPQAPQPTAPPKASNGNGNGNANGNGQNNNQNQGNNGQNQNQGNGNQNSGNDNQNNGNGNQNQNQGNGNQNQGNGNGNQNQSQGNNGGRNGGQDIAKGVGSNGNGNQNQGNDGNGNGNTNTNQNQNQGNNNGRPQNQNQGNGNGNRNGNGNANTNTNNNQQGNNQGNGQAPNSNQNNASNGLQLATLGSSNANANKGNNNNNQGQRQPQQQSQQAQSPGGSPLRPAQLGSQKPAGN